jgi:hypothetical protein
MGNTPISSFQLFGEWQKSKGVSQSMYWKLDALDIPVQVVKNRNSFTIIDPQVLICFGLAAQNGAERDDCDSAKIFFHSNSSVAHGSQPGSPK